MIITMTEVITETIIGDIYNITANPPFDGSAYSINLHLGDCMEVMRKYEDNYFDLAVIEHNFGLDKKISNGGTWAAKYKGFDGKLGGKPTKEYFDELFRVSKNQIVWGGAIILLICSTLHVASSFGIRNQRCTRLLTAKWLGLRLIRTQRYSPTSGIQAKNVFISAKSQFRYIGGFIKTTPRKGIRYSTLTWVVALRPLQQV